MAEYWAECAVKIRPNGPKKYTSWGPQNYYLQMSDRHEILCSVTIIWTLLFKVTFKKHETAF